MPAFAGMTKKEGWLKGAAVPDSARPLRLFILCGLCVNQI